MGTDAGGEGLDSQAMEEFAPNGVTTRNCELSVRLHNYVVSQKKGREGFPAPGTT